MVNAASSTQSMVGQLFEFNGGCMNSNSHASLRMVTRAGQTGQAGRNVQQDGTGQSAAGLFPPPLGVQLS